MQSRRRALAALFKGAISKDTVSRVWRKVKTDWEAWSNRSLGEEDSVRLILDGTVVRVRLGNKATSIWLLVVLGVIRDDGPRPTSSIPQTRLQPAAASKLKSGIALLIPPKPGSANGSQMLPPRPTPATGTGPFLRRSGSVSGRFRPGWTHCFRATH